MDQDYPVSRPASTTSSLDPYYFGLQSPSDSPAPPLPPGPIYLSTTPDQRPIHEPVTPAKDPATIDRRGLVGVGELATPRWTRTEQHSDEEPSETAAEIESYAVVVPEDVEEDEPDSPWTIEAVDGEMSEKEDVCVLFPTFFFAEIDHISRLNRSWNQSHQPAHFVPDLRSQTKVGERKFCIHANITRLFQMCRRNPRQNLRQTSSPLKPCRRSLPPPQARSLSQLEGQKSAPLTSLRWINSAP